MFPLPEEYFMEYFLLKLNSNGCRFLYITLESHYRELYKGVNFTRKSFPVTLLIFIVVAMLNDSEQFLFLAFFFGLYYIWERSLFSKEKPFLCVLYMEMG